MIQIDLKQIKDIIDNNDRTFIEELAQKAQQTTIQYFGRAVSLYAPIYLANYCDNHCIYCGFQQSIKMERKLLTVAEMRPEMKKVADTGMQNILLLTGESRKMTPVSYIKDAVIAAKEFFPAISLEVYPLETEEYKELYEAGVDGITVYQETYNKERYKLLHRKGKKADYDYRYGTPVRIAKSGIRMIGMGVLLGLSEIAEDIYHLFTHLHWMEKHYPGVEYSVSFPRLIPLETSPVDYVDVSDVILIKLICLSRILFPRVGINLSTREGESIRDHALQIGVTRISAASKTNVGGYTSCETKNPQFEVIDNRSVGEITNMLRSQGFDPVFTDWRRIDNR
jgi:2-iminoacetate synthase